MRSASLPLLAFMILSGIPILFAQDSNPPRGLRLEVAPREKPIELRRLEVRAEIVGTFAVTTFDMTFYNPNDRVLEGTLNFPLLDGQTITRFAMDLEGTLREAAPVEKARGQQIFEEIERKNIDPALLEKTEGNNYRVRVYPIPAKGTKRVVVAYQEQLAGAKPLYRLPLSLPSPVKEFALRLEVPKGNSEPTVALNTLGLNLPEWQQKYILETKQADFAAHGVLELEIPKPGQAAVLTGEWKGKTYFYAEVAVPPGLTARKPAGTVGLIWDSSGSGRNRDHEKEFALLDQYFPKEGKVRVKLYRMAELLQPDGEYAVENGDWSTLKKALDATAYDGATAYAGTPEDREVDEWILFSDGLANFGAPGVMRGKIPVHTVLASVSADPARLRGIADRTGGAFANLISISAAEAAKRLRQPEEKIEAEEQPAFSEVVIAPVGEDGIARVAGVLTAKSGVLKLRKGEAVIEVKVDVGARSSDLAPKAWAALQIAVLDADYEEYKKQIREIGKNFGIVTRETSLIILDRPEDYVEYEIDPPADLKEECARIAAAQARQQEKTGAEHMEKVVAMFEERKAWWERNFPKDTPPKPKDPAKARNGDGRAANGAGAPLDESFAQPMAPAPAEAGAPGGADSAEPGGVSIQLAKWEPNAPYLRKLSEAGDIYRAYLEERNAHANSTAFFLDAADVFFKKQQHEIGIRVLSNLAEMELENHAILRILGYRLLQAGRADLAAPVFERVLELRPEDPQSYRDLALACAACKQYQRAADLLWKVVSTQWDGRFPEIEVIALGELNALIETCGEKLDLAKVDPRLRKNLPVALRVILTWDADNCDMDLWVTDPNGEKAYYGNRLTYQGGKMSADFTGGYGPEEFLLKNPKPGKYIVEANYYGNRQQIIAGATTIQLGLFTNFGKQDEKVERITMRLGEKQEVVKVGEFEVK